MIRKDKVIEQLMAEMSRRNIDLVAQLFLEGTADIGMLIEIILQNEEKVSFRASWVLDKLSEKLDKPVADYISTLILILPQISNSGTRRTITKVLMLHDIPSNNEAELLDYCIIALQSPKEPVAVKSNCMTIVFKLLPKYPELKNEIFAIIENEIQHNSSAFEGRFNILKKKISFNI